MTDPQRPQTPDAPAPIAPPGDAPPDEAFLRRLLAASPDCIKVLDLDGRLLSMTEAGRRAMEIDDLAPHLGTCWTEGWHGADHDAAAVAIATAKAGGTGRFEAGAVTDKGTLKWWDVTITAIPGPGGQPERLLSISRDITPQHADRDAAAERLDQLRSVIASAKDYAVITVDPGGRIVGWSAGAVGTFGWSEADAVGRPFDLIWTPQDLATGAPGKELAVAKASGVAPDNRWHLRADGRRIYVRGATRPVRNAAGELTGYVKVCRDETDRETAGAALRQSEERFRQLADAMPQIVFAARPDGTVDYYNHRWYEYTGLPPGTTGDVGWDTVLHADDYDRTLATWGESLRTGEPYEIEYRFRRASDGTHRWHLGRALPIRDDRGEIVRWFGTNTDIDDKRRAETERTQLLGAIEAERANLRAVVEQAPSFIAVFRGPAHVYELANDRYYDLIGRRDVRGQTIRAALPEVEGQGFFEMLDAVYATGEPSFGSEVPVLLRSGPDGTLDRRVVNFVFQAIRGPDGRVSGLFVHGVDVTDSVRAREAVQAGERQRRLALDSAELGSWHIDSATQALTADERFRTMFGLAGGGATTYEQAFAAIHPEDRPRVRAAVEASMRPDDPAPYASEYRVVHPDGSIRWVFGKGRANAGGDGPGQPGASLDGTVADVTDRKRAEGERVALLESERAARAEAERASQMKDDFLATLSHELRTPLNAIVGWSQILRSAPGDAEEVAEGLAVIDRNARAQTQIIEDILDMSRIVSGKLRLDVQRVDLAAVVRAGVETVQPAADAKGIRLAVLLDPAAGPVSGDPNRLHQVFWNLLSNAVKFTPKGGRVQALLERVNSHVEVSVVDTGEGIAADFLPHVFDRFRQADGSTTRRHGGLGLGLAIVRQLVELHGGSVRVKSPGPGQGSTFVVALPLTAVHPDLAGPPVTREHPEAAVPMDAHHRACGQLAGVTVLAVDDEPDGRAVIKRLLEACGAVVRTAGSADEAMALLAQAVPAVLVSDIGMPGQDGYALIRRVRSLPPERGGRVHALALTAYARAADRVRALEAGFQMHLAKPVESTELVVTVATLAERAGHAGG